MPQSAIDLALADVRRRGSALPPAVGTDIDRALAGVRANASQPGVPASGTPRISSVASVAPLSSSAPVASDTSADDSALASGILAAVEHGRTIRPSDIGASALRAVDAVTSLPGVSQLFHVLRMPQQALAVGPGLAFTKAATQGKAVTAEDVLSSSAKALRQDLGFRDVAESTGLKGRALTTAGLLGDLVLDPLWIATPAKVAKLARLPELARSGAVRAVVDAAKETKGGQVLGKALIPDFGKPAAYVALAEQHGREVQSAVEAAHEIGQRLNQLPTEAQRAVRSYMEAGSETGRLAVLNDARAAGLDSEAIGALGHEAMTRDVELGRSLVDVGLMNEQTFEKWRGRHVRREYRKFVSPRAFLDDLATKDPEAAAKLEATLKDRAGFTGNTAPLRERLSFLKQRKDLPEDLRAAMGEILEAPGPVARGQALAGTAVARRRFLNQIATQFSSDSLQPGFKYAGDTAALGPLKGKFLPEAITEDVELVLRRPGQAERLWKQGVGLWKLGKTALNPATHARNLMSNLILADMAGLAPFKVHRYGEALRDLVTDGRWTQEAKAAGASFFSNTFAGVELKRLGQVPADATGLQRAWARVANVLEKPAKLYQAEEQWFKLAFYIDQRAKGITPGAAVQASEQALFNYRKVPRLVDEMRTWGVVPFASFPYFAAQATGRALVNRPAAISRYGHLFRVFEDKASAERERRVLPSYMKDGWIRLPGTDTNGRIRYVNGQYILPFGDLSDVATLSDPGGAPGDVGRLVGQRIPLLQLGAAIVTGVDPFTQQPVDKMPGGWKTWLANFLLPPLAGGNASREIVAAAQGRPTNPLSRYAEPRSLGQALLANLGGIRIRPVNLDEEQRRRVESLTWEVRDVQQEIRRYQRSKWLTEAEREDALQGQMARVRTLVRMIASIDGRDPGDEQRPSGGAQVDVDAALQSLRRGRSTQPSVGAAPRR